MRLLTWATVAGVLCWTSGAVAAPVRASADGYEVSIVSNPPVIVIGKSELRISLQRNGKPVSDARVRALVRMPNMDMGEKEAVARPVQGEAGVYAAPAVFAMAGEYVAEIKVDSGGRESVITAPMATGMDTGPGAPDRRPLYYGLGALMAVILAVWTLIRMRATGQSLELRSVFRLQVAVSLALLVGAVALSVYAVRNWRRPGAMTPIEAQAMEMATPPPPGTAIVKLAAVERGLVEQTVTCTGQAVGWTEQEVLPRVSGWITEMPVYVGTRVRKGDILARLDTSQIAPMVAERSAMLRAGVSASRTARWSGEGAAAMEREAAASLRSARAEVQAAESERASVAAEAEAAEAMLASARLSTPAAKAALAAARADQAYRSAELKRMQALYDKKAVSADELDQARAMAAAASAAVEQAESGLGKAEADVRGAEAAQRKALANLDTARRKVSVARERTSASEASLEAARVAVKSAASGVAEARASASAAAAALADVKTQEGYAVIRATADGVVTRRLVSPGTLATPGRPILLLAEDRPIRLQAAVSETDLGRIRIGATVRVRRPGGDGATVTTRISSVAGAVDPTTRTGVVEAIWPNAAERFNPGAAVVMEIVVARSAHVLRAPSEAVNEMVPGDTAIEGRTVRHTVWLADPLDKGTYTARRASFTAGIEGRRFTEIIDGLDEGALVVVDGGRNLRDGDHIAPAAEPGDVYVCPMHPDVRQDGPGTCPKCLMALEKEKRKP